MKRQVEGALSKRLINSISLNVSVFVNPIAFALIADMTEILYLNG